MGYIVSPSTFDPANLDSFFRFRVAQPQTIFDSKQLSDKQVLFWDDQQTSGSGTTSTYNTNQSSTSISVSASTSGTRIRQTFRRFNYQPGKSQMFVFTGVFGAAVTGITRRAGMFDSNNGIFFDQNSSGMGVTIRTYTSGSPVDTRISQSNWNLDPMDGTGPSKINLDFTKAQVWFADFEWLGVGGVRFGFYHEDKPYYCHIVRNANVLSTVYMSTPNLPLRFEIQNDGTGGAASLTQICSTVIAEGGLERTGFSLGITRGSTPLTTLNNSSIYPLIAIRLNSSYLGSTISISDFSVVCTSNSTFNYYIILDPTIVGTPLTFTALSNSSVDYCINTTSATTLTGGTIIKTGSDYINNNGQLSSSLPEDFTLGSSIAGASNILVLAVQRITGSTETFYASINFRDQQ